MRGQKKIQTPRLQKPKNRPRPNEAGIRGVKATENLEENNEASVTQGKLFNSERQKDRNEAR